MNWTEQVDSMMKMWGDAQKQFLGQWQDLGRNFPMSGLPGMSAMPDLSNPMSWFMPGSSAWPQGTGIGQNTVGNLFSSQAMMMQTLGMLAQAWKTIAPSLSDGKPWQPDLDVFLKQWQSEIFGTPQRLSQTGTSIGDLAKSLMSEWGPLLKPWLASIQSTGLGGPMGDLLTEGKGPLGKLFGNMNPAFQDLAQIPMVGVNREQMAKIMRAFDVHVDVRKASYKYQTAIAKTIGEAMKETMENLVELSKKGEQLGNVRDLIRIWVKIADRKFTEMYVSDEFLEIQREVSKTNLRNKMAQRAVLEMFLKQVDIPTRTELDDAYKTLHNVKRDVRELRTDTVDVRNAHKQTEAEIMEFRNARKQAQTEAAEFRNARSQTEAEVAELRNTLKKLETKIVSLQDELKKMENANQAAKTPAQAPVSAPAAAQTTKEPSSPPKATT